MAAKNHAVGIDHVTVVPKSAPAPTVEDDEDRCSADGSGDNPWRNRDQRGEDEADEN